MLSMCIVRGIENGNWVRWVSVGYGVADGVALGWDGGCLSLWLLAWFMGSGCVFVFLR